MHAAYPLSGEDGLTLCWAEPGIPYQAYGSKAVGFSETLFLVLPTSCCCSHSWLKAVFLSRAMCGSFLWAFSWKTARDAPRHSSRILQRQTASSQILGVAGSKGPSSPFTRPFHYLENAFTKNWNIESVPLVPIPFLTQTIPGYMTLFRGLKPRKCLFCSTLWVAFRGFPWYQSG